MQLDNIRLVGSLSVYVGDKRVAGSKNTITYAGFRWFLKQMSGWYKLEMPDEHNRTIDGVRIGDGGGTGETPYYNDPTLTDVRAPIVGTNNVEGNRKYVPFSETNPLNCPDVFPRKITIDSIFDMTDFKETDFKNKGTGDPFINEAGLWVPPTRDIDDIDQLEEDERPVLATYTVLKNSSGQLVSLPVFDTVEILFRWEIYAS